MRFMVSVTALRSAMNTAMMPRIGLTPPVSQKKRGRNGAEPAPTTMLSHSLLACMRLGRNKSSEHLGSCPKRMHDNKAAAASTNYPAAVGMSKV